MSPAAAAQFAQRWLPAWSGNDPERLAAFYSDDALYVDPGIPAGARGKAELLAYFRKLLAHNPNWVWTQLEAIPLEGGFLNKWLAKIPVGAKTLEIVGVCLVQLDAAARSAATKCISTGPSCWRRSRATRVRLKPDP